MAKKPAKQFGKDPQLLQTGRRSKRITPGVRNALIGAVLLIAAAELLLRIGLIPEEGALVLDIVGLIVALGAGMKAVRS